MAEEPRVKVYVGCHTEFGYGRDEDSKNKDNPNCLGSESIALEIEGDFDLVYPDYGSSGFHSASEKGIEKIRNGKYSFCTCGRSNRMPFCDQTHQLVKFPEPVIRGGTPVYTNKPWDRLESIHRLQVLLKSKENIEGVSDTDREVILSLRGKDESDIKNNPHVEKIMLRVAEAIDEDMLNNMRV